MRISPLLQSPVCSLGEASWPDAPTHMAYVALGANLGEPRIALCFARHALACLPQTRIVRASSLYRTAPVEAPGQPDYLNAVLLLETGLTAEGLLVALLSIEAQAGRERLGHNAARTLDLDLLLHGDSEITMAKLTLPHPRMHMRAFVLHPLVEIAPTLILPGQGPVQALLDGVKNQRIVRLDTPWESRDTPAFSHPVASSSFLTEPV
jgi:2-amino-4-hydroxy-6-hydroxymethyldihydropteridine diphosphokinase